MDLPYNEDIDLANLFLYHRGLALLDCDEDGVPTFEDYFGLVYDRAPPAMLAELAAGDGPSVSREVADHLSRTSVGIGYTVHGVANVLVALYEDPEDALEAFIRMLRKAVAQAQVEEERL